MSLTRVYRRMVSGFSRHGVNNARPSPEPDRDRDRERDRSRTYKERTPIRSPRGPWLRDRSQSLERDPRGMRYGRVEVIPPHLLNVRTAGAFLNYAAARIKSGIVGYAHVNGMNSNDKTTSTRPVFGQMTISAEDDAHFLVCETLGIPVFSSRPEIEAKYDRTLTAKELLAMEKLLVRRIRDRIPMAYILGCAYFHGERYVVNENVLIPRSFVGEALMNVVNMERTQGDDDLQRAEISAIFGDDYDTDLDGGVKEENLFDPSLVSSVLDLCSGSGCLAVLASRVFNNAKKVHLTDICSKAISVARKNIADKKLEARISIFEGDLFSSIPKGITYDLILCNPPYVRKADMIKLPREYKFEPRLALEADDDGIAIISRVLEEASGYLSPPRPRSSSSGVNEGSKEIGYIHDMHRDGGLLICEIGDTAVALVKRFPALQDKATWLDTEASSGEVLVLSKRDLDTVLRTSKLNVRSKNKQLTAISGDLC
jgi:ribosomal protein L3 glutamine methyltransferase